MYHGSPNDFSVFDLKKARYSGTFGKGFYFTDSNSHASTYGNLYRVYLDVKNPVTGEIPVDKRQLKKFITAVADNEDYSIENYGTYDTDTILNQINKTDLFTALRDINSTAIGDFAEAVKLYNKVNGTDYDGIISNTETVVFSPNQIKSATDNIGTYDGGNNDIRYSLKDKQQLIDEYGEIKPGENPEREVHLPKKISNKKVVSQFARTMMEAGVTPDNTVSEFEKSVLDGTMTHEVITDNRAKEYAVKKIKEYGWNESIDLWNKLTKENKVGKKEMALGMQLYNQAIQNKDVSTAMKLAADLVVEATKAGQALQSLRMLKQMTPDGKLYYIEKSVTKMNKDIKEQLGEKKFKDIKIDEDIAKRFLSTSDEEARNAIYDELCQDIASQIPATIKDKWDAWRYMAMLANPRTHARNIIGNAAFIPAVKLKNLIGWGIEYAAEKTGNLKHSERTKTFAASHEAKDFAKADFGKMQKVLEGTSGKYAMLNNIEDYRRIFNTGLLELVRKKNFDALEAEDLLFLKAHYIEALSKAITARGVDINSLTEGSTELESVRAYAISEAQKATYRDANAVAKALNAFQAKAKKSKSAAYKAAGVLSEGIMPFKSTPFNILRRGVEYSPIGLLSGIAAAKKALQNGTKTGSDIIDSISAGLSGTAIMVLGYWLSSIGFLKGSGDEDDKKRKFDEERGEQAYSIQTGGKTYTIDWMAPSSLPLFIGTELNNLSQQDGIKLPDVANALSKIAEPMLELSVLQGLSSTLDNVAYSKTNKLFAIPQQMGISYVTQAIPTFSGVVARIADPIRRITSTDKESEYLSTTLQKFIQQSAKKIPGATKLLEPQIDRWGREVTYGSTGERLVENLISPGYYENVSDDPVDTEINRLYAETGEKKILPGSYKSTITHKKVQYQLKPKQYTEYKKLCGSKAYELISEMIERDSYKSISDEKKVSKIDDCFTKAKESADKEMLKRLGVTDKKREEDAANKTVK